MPVSVSRTGSSRTRVLRPSFIGRLVLIAQFLLAPVMWSGAAVVGAQETWTMLPTIPTSDDTATTPQSKAWFHGHTWWTVLPSSTPSSGSWLYRLEPNNTWTAVLKVSSMKGRSDVKAVGNLAHVLLVSSDAQVVTIEYQAALQTYRLWPVNPSPVPVFVGESGTLEVDSTGKLWLATDHLNWVDVYYADYPYASFTGPISLTDQTSVSDVNAIVAFPNNTIGVFWGNAVLERWGFRVHVDGTDPAVWLEDELPALAGHENLNMADDHLNLALAANGTLYAAVKPKSSSSTIPPLYLLVRRPAPGLPGGVWDSTLYPVDPFGTGSVNGRRPQVLLDEDTNTIRVFYQNSSGTIYFRESDATEINFGPAEQLMSSGFEYLTSAKARWAGRLVVLATKSGTAGVLITTNPGLVGYWKMDDGGGAVARDLSGWGNGANLLGGVTSTPGIKGYAVNFDGSTGYGSVSDQAALDATTSLTLSAWIKPQAQGAQDIISRATVGGVDGYSLSLNPTNAAIKPGSVYMHFNEASSGSTYRVDSITRYPTDGITWMHVAATYDGTAMRMYINGVEEASTLGPPSIAANLLAVGLGAQGNGARKFRGQMDEVRIYRRALTAEEIGDLARVPQTNLQITKTNGGSSVTIGQQTTYTIVASNSGPEDVFAIVTDNVPSRLTGATWTCTAAAGASCPQEGSGSINSLVSLPVGGSTTFTLRAMVAPGSGTSLVNTATVSPNGIDPVPANNSATDTDTILQPVAPVITTQPASVTVTAPSPATFTVVASGAAPLSYQWRRNGTAISGATGPSYTLSSTAVSNTGWVYTVTVSNAGGTVTSAGATLTVNAAPVAPSITTQPASMFAIEPGGAMFSVLAAGTSPLSYQWRRNGAPIPGATGASYTLNPTAVGDSGAVFSVVVTNSVNSVTSAGATLTVFGGGAGATLIDAHFDTGPDGFTYLDDAFRGTDEPSYATGTHVTSGGFTGGALRVVVGGVNSQNIQGMSGGWRTSFTLAGPTPVVLVFRQRLTEQNTYEAGEYTEMLVSLDGALQGVAPNDYIARVVGGGPTTTGWQLVQLNLGVLSAGTHVLTLGAYNNQKTYPDESAEVLIDDLMLQAVGSSSATPPSITTQPASVTVTAPAQASFSVVATGTAPLSYQWRRNGVAIPGATSATYVLNPTAVGDSGALFTVDVSNSANTVTSTAATLTVNAASVAPSITTPPASVTVTAPAQAAFSVVATGTAPLSYQWRRNGTAIPGATSATYVLNPTAAGDNGALFSVTVSNSIDTVTSAAATLTVNTAAVAPSITTPPASMTVTAPTQAAFSVVAGGTAPLSYQWRRNGVPIPGATGASYAVNPTTMTDSGALFSVSVSNSVSTVTSSAAMLTVLDGGGGGGAALIDAHFDSGSDGFTYADDVFRATAQPGYASGEQLTSGGFTGGALKVLLGGINGSNIQKISGGWQRSFTLAASGPVTLTFRYKLGITLLKSERFGQMLVSLDGVLYGVGPDSYVAQLLGGTGGVTSTTGWQAAQLDLGTVPAGTHVLALGGYLSGKSGSSETADVLIDDLVVQSGSAPAPAPPTITSAPSSVAVIAPAPASFSVAATGAAPLSYQWRRNGAAIAGATGASYTLNPTDVADDGALFSVDVSNSVSTVTSAAAVLSVSAASTPPSITTHPANVTVTAPAQAAFSVVATGTAPLGYQWRRNGTLIPGATGASYVLNPTAVGDNGALFSVDVSNSVTTVTSAAATLTVNAAAVAPSIVTPPANVTVTAPAQATFSVVASGTAPLSYQWRRNGTVIPGATNASYVLNPTAVGDSGAQFSVDVTNSVTTISSPAATLTVLDGGGGGGAAVLDANFNAGADGFMYLDDLFRGTVQPGYANGAQLPAGGFAGGGLQVLLGGINGSNVQKMSGGWQRSFTLSSAGTTTLTFRYKLSATVLKSERFGQLLVSVDGVLYGVPPNTYVAQVMGGTGGVSSSTGWQQAQIVLGPLAAGTHVLSLGGYLSGKSGSSEVVEVVIDDVAVSQ